MHARTPGRLSTFGRRREKDAEKVAAAAAKGAAPKKAAGKLGKAKGGEDAMAAMVNSMKKKKEVEPPAE